MKPFPKIFTNKLEKGINTFFKNNIKKQGGFFSTTTESHLNGIGVDNHDLPLVVKEEKNDTPTCMPGVGIDNHAVHSEPSPKTLFVAKKENALSICLQGVGIDNYEPKVQPSFFIKKEHNDISTHVNGVGIDNYERVFSK